MIIEVLSDYAKGATKKHVYEKIVTQNAYGIRTVKSRERFLRGISATYLKFKNDNHRNLFNKIFTKTGIFDIKRFVIFLQFAINNQLFYELTTKVFVKLYLDGRLTINKTEIVSFLYDLRDKETSVKTWSDSTINTVAYKYLTLLKKIGFLKGSVKKEFCHIVLTDDIIILLVYIIKSIDEMSPNFLENPYCSLLLLTRESIIDRLKKIALKDYFNITTLGFDLKIELKYSFEDIVDVVIKNN